MYDTVKISKQPIHSDRGDTMEFRPPIQKQDDTEYRLDCNAWIRFWTYAENEDQVRDAFSDAIISIEKQYGVKIEYDSVDIRPKNSPQSLAGLLGQAFREYDDEKDS
jgi:hypothetical protein